MSSERILVVRLGAMGDIVHALPAVASLKRSFPDRKLSWIVRPRWLPLLEGNPSIDELIPFEKIGGRRLKNSFLHLTRLRPALAVDFQGLVQSAILGRLSRPREFWGFDMTVARERLAAAFYSNRAAVRGPHRVERNLQLVRAAGATQVVHEAWLPPGRPEQGLPSGPFLLASPFAGWAGKQWPLEYYAQLGSRLRKEGITLVVNVSREQSGALHGVTGIEVQTSSISGLIHATREATAIVGVDSGPLHLAAALSKPGVAIFGPTDPDATGPYGGSMTVLRTHAVETTYDRHSVIQASMRAISPEQVHSALMKSLSTTEAVSKQRS